MRSRSSTSPIHLAAIYLLFVGVGCGSDPTSGGATGTTGTGGDTATSTASVGGGGATSSASSGTGGDGTSTASSSTGGPTPVKLTGAAAKGPFIIGTSVNVSPVDASGNPMGMTFPTLTDDDVGNFSVSFTYQGPVQLDATGQWYDEISGATDANPLTLHGLALVTSAGSQNAYINTITHLTYLRIKTLMLQGAALPAAVSQAESELRGQLKMGSPGFNPNATGSQLNLLGGDTDQAAYIFAMSAVSLLAAQEGKLTGQAYLNTVQSSFQTNGTVSASLVAKFDQAHRDLEPDDVMPKLSAYFTQTSFAGTVPDINRVLDTDGDGVVNANDDCVLIQNANQAPVRGLCAYHKTPLPQSMGGSGSLVSINGDIDGDGDLDVVTILWPSAGVYVNDGKGAFTLQSLDLMSALGIPANTQVQFSSAALGDLSGDGKTDLVLSYLTNFGPPAFLVVLPGNGNGTFGAPTTIWSNPLSGPVSSIKLADVNGDGKLDVVGGMSNPPGIFPKGNTMGVLAQVFINPGVGIWAAPIQIKATGPVKQTVIVTDVVVGQFTADANPDILVAASTTSGPAPFVPDGLYLLTGNGNGGFALGAPSALVDACTLSMTTGDFDEDSHLDVALLDAGATKLTVAFGAGDGTFGAPVSTPVGAPPGFNDSCAICAPCPSQNALNQPGYGGALAVTAGHFTGGAHWDIAVGASVFVSNGRNPAAQQFVRFTGPAVSPLTGVVITPPHGDFNGDGSTDLWLDDNGVAALLNPAGYHSW